MKSLTFISTFALALLMVSRPAIAQTDPGQFDQYDPQNWFKQACPSCGVVSYVDLPGDQQTVSASSLVFQGWGFECVSGQPIDRVDVWYQDYDGFWRPLKQAEGTLLFGARPDVNAAFRDGCPNVTVNAGWALIVTNPPPPGLRRVGINVWRGPYHEWHVRTYLVRP